MKLEGYVTSDISCGCKQIRERKPAPHGGGLADGPRSAAEAWAAQIACAVLV